MKAEGSHLQKLFALITVFSLVDQRIIIFPIQGQHWCFCCISYFDQSCVSYVLVSSAWGSPKLVVVEDTNADTKKFFKKCMDQKLFSRDENLLIWKRTVLRNTRAYLAPFFCWTDNISLNSFIASLFALSVARSLVSNSFSFNSNFCFSEET